MAEPVTIPLSIVEVTLRYASANLEFAMNRAAFAQGFFQQLQRWEVKVDDLEVVNEGKPSEQGLRFKVPQQRMSIFFGPAHARLVWEGANWVSTESVMQLLTMSIDALATYHGIQIGFFNVAVALHLQLRDMPFIDLLKPFSSPLLTVLDRRPLQAFATVLKWDGRSVTIDGSAQIANGLFLRFERDYDGAMRLDQIAEAVLADEQHLFAILDVEEASL